MWKNKLVNMLCVCAALLSTSSCDVSGGRDWNPVPSYIETYSHSLRRAVLELPVTEISRMLDYTEEPLFDKDIEFRTALHIANYYGESDIDMTFSYLGDTVWTVRVYSGPDAELENLEASGTFSFSTVKKDVREWAVSMSGTTEEDTGYSSSFSSDGVKFFLHRNDFKKLYECKLNGDFKTLFLQDGKQKTAFNLSYHENEIDEFPLTGQ